MNRFCRIRIGNIYKISKMVVNKLFYRITGVAIFLLGLFFLYSFGQFPASNQIIDEPGSEIANEDSLISVRVIAAGDAMCHSPQFTQAKKPASNTYDFSGCFQYMTDILATGDLNIVNLETTLAGAPYSGYPQFCAPDEFAAALQEAGFNFFLLANNHCADKGSKGVISTIEKLQKLQIPSAGTYLNKSDRQQRHPALMEINGIKIALLNYTYSTNGLSVTAPVSVNYLHDTTQIKKDLEAAKLQQADIIIAFLHWGTEYRRTPDDRQKAQAQFFFENGTDMIIGSHPHVIEPMEYFAYNPADTTQKKLIYWSLGNFISNQRKEHTDGGIMASFTITKNKNTQQIRVENETAIPYWVYRKPNLFPGYFVLPTERFLNDSTTFSFSHEDRAAFELFERNTREMLEK